MKHEVMSQETVDAIVFGEQAPVEGALFTARECSQREMNAELIYSGSPLRAFRVRQPQVFIIGFGSDLDDREPVAESHEVAYDERATRALKRARYPRKAAVRRGGNARASMRLGLA